MKHNKRTWNVAYKSIETHSQAVKHAEAVLTVGTAYCKKHSLGPNDKPVKVKKRPNGTFDVKVLVSDVPVKEKKEQ